MEEPARRRVQSTALTKWTRELLARCGLREPDAQACGEVFVLQEMRGVHHHGLSRLPDLVEGLRDGSINPVPRRSIASRAGGMSLLDADRGPGVAACRQAMGLAIQSAEVHGLGMVTVRNSSHFLAGAPYCLQAVDAGMLGIATTNAPASMAYPGARTPLLSNGPLAFGVPSSGAFPVVFDAAMTASGGHLIELAQRQDLLPNYLGGLDDRGEPTRDPAKVLDGGATLPIGMHKGAGLVLMLEVLTGVLGGGAFVHQPLADMEASDRIGSPSQCLIAINVATLHPRDQFEKRVEAYTRSIKAAAQAEGAAIQIPGERAQRTYNDCLANGVPVSEDLEALMQRLSQDFGVPLPWHNADG